MADERPEGVSLPPIEEKGASLLVYLQGQLNNALTDPNEIREAEAEQSTLLQNLNKSGIRAGETSFSE